MTLRPPDEILVKIAKCCLDESFYFELTDSCTHQGHPTEGHLCARGLPNLLNIKLVNRLFYDEIAKAIHAGFSGELHVDLKQLGCTAEDDATTLWNKVCCYRSNTALKTLQADENRTVWLRSRVTSVTFHSMGLDATGPLAILNLVNLQAVKFKLPMPMHWRISNSSKDIIAAKADIRVTDLVKRMLKSEVNGIFLEDLRHVPRQAKRLSISVEWGFMMKSDKQVALVEMDHTDAGDIVTVVGHRLMNNREWAKTLFFGGLNPRTRMSENVREIRTLESRHPFLEKLYSLCCDAD